VLVPALGQLAVIGLTALEHLCSVNVRHASTNTALTTLVVAMLLVTLIINEASYRGLVALTNCSMARLNSQLCNETL
jgi:DTW domain-containing protein YfiP